MDSFTEPFAASQDDIDIDRVRAQVADIERAHKANGIPLSGRILHICHYLPVTAVLSSHSAVPSPPLTPPFRATETPPESDTKLEDNFQSIRVKEDAPIWTLSSRYGHSAMVSGIRSLSATHEQLIVGWIGDINSTHGERIPEEDIGLSDKVALDEALQQFQPKESDPDDDKKTTYIPVWMNDKVAHGHYDGYCKQSTLLFVSFNPCALMLMVVPSSLAPLPLPPMAGCRYGICLRRLSLPLL
jgi:trehalose 6-phosphate synthase/phosphatase